MTAKRPIEPMAFDGLAPADPSTGKPELTWISPSELLVDETYQRGLSEKGLRLIRRIMENFDWRKFKPPTCVWTDDGLEVIDGQHSAIGAATHPQIDQIPVVIVDAPEIDDRAKAFIGINRDRLGITAMQLHAAALVAGDDEAKAIERVCAASGVHVLKNPPSNGKYKPRDTVAIQAIAGLIKRTGEPIAAEVVRVLAEADLAPVTALALKAAETLLVDPEYADSFEASDLSKAIVALGPEGEKEAAVFAATHCVPKWKGLVAVWFKKVKKRRAAPDTSGKSTAHFEPQVIENVSADCPEADQRSPPSEPVQKATKYSETIPAKRASQRFLGGSGRVSGTSASMVGERIGMGEPPPGRSALDQRKAEAVLK